MQYEHLHLEIADLCKGDDLTFVKIGAPQKLNYVVDQSLGTLKFLQRNQNQVLVSGSSHTIRALTLWLFLKRKDPVTSLAEIESLIFLMRLAHWRREVLLAGLTPRVKLSYKR